MRIKIDSIRHGPPIAYNTWMIAEVFIYNALSFHTSIESGRSLLLIGSVLNVPPFNGAKYTS